VNCDSDAIRVNVVPAECGDFLPPVQGDLVVELKLVGRLSPLHSKQLLACLRLLPLPLGLLINFGAPTFRDGIKPVVSGSVDLESSILRANQMELKRLTCTHERKSGD